MTDDDGVVFVANTDRARTYLDLQTYLLALRDVMRRHDLTRPGDTPDQLPPDDKAELRRLEQRLAASVRKAPVPELHIDPLGRVLVSRRGRWLFWRRTPWRRLGPL